jgi:uncharacterized protein (TIGR03435 family)
MLQNLLAERFKLAVHSEPKMVSAYTLVVGNGGPNLKESADNLSARDDAGSPASRPTVTIDKEGSLCPLLRVRGLS